MSKSIIWTLQNPCPSQWINKFTEFNYLLQYQPLIELKVNDNYYALKNEVKKYDTFIISSQFSANQIVSVLEGNCHILTIGDKATEILKNVDQTIIHTAYNSEKLSSYIGKNIESKILHPCSDKSDTSIWPVNVDSFPYYGPMPNPEFDISNVELSPKSIIVFGSPSGVDVWFENNFNSQDATVATIGNTTAKQFTNYTQQVIITPQISTIKHLCEAIYNHLKYSGI